MKALVTGGYFDDGGHGVVWVVDFETGRADVFAHWTPPPHLKVAGKGFAGGTMGPDGSLYVAAHAAVVRVDVSRASVTGVLHQPCMNDLHHVAARGERLYVANTGLDAVDVLTLDGAFVGTYSLLPTWANARRMNGEALPAGVAAFTPGWRAEPPTAWAPVGASDGYHSEDLRGAPFHQLKVPDALHVNHVAFVGDRLLATCFADGSLRDLQRFEVATTRPDAFLHDGVVHGDGLWLTAIDGSVIELDAETFAERRTSNVFGSGHFGWCRGLAVSDEHLVVGLTEVRCGRMPRHRWADQSPEGSETSVLLLNRDDLRVVARVALTDAARHSKVYSIIPMREVRS